MASVGDEDANFASPTSSQFVHREKKAATGTKGSSALAKKHMGKGLQERITQLTSQNGKKQTDTLEEALVDLYLSVKIRSNEEVSQVRERKYLIVWSSIIGKDLAAFQFWKKG